MQTRQNVLVEISVRPSALRRSQSAQASADELGTTSDRGSEQWKSWRDSDQWTTWNQAIAPVVAARRRCLRLLGDKQAVGILFADIAPRFSDRPGGYTRILRLAKPRLGDAGTRAILEFVGVHDRVVQRSEKPAFDDATDEATEDVPQSESADELEAQAEQADADETDEEK